MQYLLELFIHVEYKIVSFKKEDFKNISIFEITDKKDNIKVFFKGQLPDLFREGQGIVAEGILKDNKLIANQVLAKHDENYMPPEVAAALRNENFALRQKVLSVVCGGGKVTHRLFVGFNKMQTKFFINNTGCPL